MKDAVHHLRHIQKKVIQFARKAANPEYSAASAGTLTAMALEFEGSRTKRKRRLFNSLPQAARHQ